VLLASDDGGEESTPQGAVAVTGSTPFLRAGVRGCRERVEGGKIAPDSAGDTIVGPITFTRLPFTYRLSVRDRHRVTPEYLPGLHAHPMKVLALVRAGTEVRLVVPKAQRSWMRLFYSGRRLGEHTVTLRACRQFRSPAAQRRECAWGGRLYTACRWINTQFAGGIYVDFDHAPGLGWCAELIVQVKGGRSLRERVFRPKPGTCTDRSA
jgi:hypothetical protein